MCPFDFAVFKMRLSSELNREETSMFEFLSGVEFWGYLLSVRGSQWVFGGVVVHLVSGYGYKKVRLNTAYFCLYMEGIGS